jgi:Zn-dependent peptidase ImmA (M78 family)/formiminotetrahydrofolate cyclodeaminase
MEQKPLLEYPTKELLNKFGKGGHKPGSGSAAAIQGMLAAQLIHTVISITSDEKYKAKYEKSLPELLRFDEDITSRIYPALEALFQKDATLFDRVIELREKRDKEADPEKKDELAKRALAALKPATDILIEIADKCADLADYAAFVFDNAFRSAKGDSGVALNGAVAALGGCLSIVDLNLSSFGSNDWTVKIREEVERLRADYNKLAAEAKNRMDSFTIVSLKKSFQFAKNDVNSGRWEGVRLSETTIEGVADGITNLLWDFRDLIWENERPNWHYDVLKPEIVLEKILGYKFGYAALGRYEQDGSEFQTAGQISTKEKVVLISEDLSSEVRNFTIAHELGHALLHGDMGVLHRDRPLDGSGSNVHDIKEVQANKFAACFLMPATTVKALFRELFSMDKFVLNDHTVFMSGEASVSAFKKRYRDLRSRSRFIAKFKGKTYQPLHKIFGVSVEAMAIRLEVLGLVQ